MNGNRLSWLISCTVEFLEDVSYNYCDIMNKINIFKGYKNTWLPVDFLKAPSFYKQPVNLK